VRDRRVLAEVKNNLGPLQSSLAYSVTGQPPAPPVLTWLGPSLWSADQLVGRHAAPAAERGRAGDFLRAFLRAFLRDGPRTAAEVWAGAREQLLAPQTLNRAKNELQVPLRRLMQQGKQQTYWLLPGQRLPAAADDDFRELDDLRCAEPNPLVPRFRAAAADRPGNRRRRAPGKAGCRPVINGDVFSI
jgi:hypothetical protein